jgi:hypothetical protein
MSWSQWISALKLSMMWKMALIQDLALRKIPTRIHNPEEWISVLKISTQSRIQELREIAIRKLGRKLGPRQKVTLGIKYSIEPWLMDGYTALVTRENGLSTTDEACLGWSTTANLFRIRHRILEARHTSYVRVDIRRTFASEFADIAAFDSSHISYLRPDLHTATDSDAIQRDKTYYYVDIVFKVKSFGCLLPRPVTHPTAGGKYFI